MTVQRIADMGSLPEHGRIRTGVKAGRAMKPLDTFRLTTTDESALHQLAEIYGGEVRPWYDKGANPPNQFELITTSSVLEVIAQPESIDSTYELWGSGGLQRQCDGEVCTEWEYGPNDSFKTTSPCLCNANGLLECKPKTRLNFIFPGIRFAGTWRYESSGKHAQHTLPSMMRVLDALAAGTNELMPIEMHLVPQERVKGRQKQKFIIVELRTKVTVDQMLLGTSSYHAQLVGGQVKAQPAIEKPMDLPEEQAPPEWENDVNIPIPPLDDDDDIIDAELVDDDEPSVLTKAEAFSLAKESKGKLQAVKVEGGWNVR